MVYKSKPFYLMLFACFCGSFFVFIDISKPLFINFQHLLFCLLFLYLFAFFTIPVFIFQNNYFIRMYPFRLPFMWKNKKYEYSDLFAVEIRKINGPYQNPIVVLHFSKKRTKSLFIGQRSFFYNDYKELLPLIKCLKEKGVRIQLNISRKYKNEYYLLSTYVKQLD
jgi:hypothetical protein